MTDVQAIRNFNRVYTHAAGLLRMYKEIDLPLAEARVLYEIGQCSMSKEENNFITASTLCQSLNLDEGYMSRILRKFVLNNWIVKKPSIYDNRQMMIFLTEKGEKECEELARKANELAQEQLNILNKEEQKHLLAAMACIESLSINPKSKSLPSNTTSSPDFLLREPLPGDMGWITQMHGEFYSTELGWNAYSEALCGQICSDFVMNRDTKRERCWIAIRTKTQERVGCVFLVKGSNSETAKLRLLFLTENARGLGIGKHLIETCLSFAKQVGYSLIELWTMNNLLKARAMYKEYGFELIHTEEHTKFGPTLIAETWRKVL